MGIANTHLCAKNQKKTNEGISRKSQKTGFSGIFPVFSAGKIFFPEIGLRHILGIAILHLCAKNHQKLMSQSREKLVTDARTNERTNGQRLIYRTSEVGPKSKKKVKLHRLSQKKTISIKNNCLIINQISKTVN